MPTIQYSCYYTSTHFEADIFKRHPEIRVDLNMANIVNANTASKTIQSVLMTLNAGIEIEGLKKTGLHLLKRLRPEVSKLTLSTA
jgi:ABC-2 type transport system permease protein